MLKQQIGLLRPLLLSRTLVYTRGENVVVRGLRKDPESYLTNPAGLKYPPSEGSLEPVRRFLGEEFNLKEPLLLQAVTHKSFAHGKKPYNEKLAIMGNHLLRLETSRAVVDESFDVHSNALELPASSFITSKVCQLAAFQNAIFWKPASETRSGERTVYSKTINALIGAVMVEHGLPKAQEFIKQRLLNGQYSVFDLSEKYFVNSD